MRDLSSYPPNDDGSDPRDQQSLERADRAPLSRRSGGGDQRSELYARLRNIIDNATESIRVLKEENAALSGQNAEMSDRIGMLEHRIRAVTADLANDELALRQSADVLEQVLQTSVRPVATPDVVAPRRAIELAPAPVEMEMETEVAPEPEPSATVSAAAVESVPPSEAPTGPLPIAESVEPEQMGAVEPQAEPVAPEMEAPAAPEPPPDAPTMEVAEMTAATPRAGMAADGTYSLTAYPFVRFSDLGQFQAALQRLAGVHDVQVRRFAQGTLEMRIGYEGGADLADALRTLTTEIEDVHEEEPYQLRVRLRTSHEA